VKVPHLIMPEIETSSPIFAKIGTKRIGSKTAEGGLKSAGNDGTSLQELVVCCIEPIKGRYLALGQ